MSARSKTAPAKRRKTLTLKDFQSIETGEPIKVQGFSKPAKFECIDYHNKCVVVRYGGDNFRFVTPNRVLSVANLSVEGFDNCKGAKAASTKKK